MNRIKRGSIHIHQLLHGYDDGHCLLAGSIKPVGQSARTLLSLSDLSGQGLTPGPNGYITGYPLPQMKAYALARTWPAPEMPRPGCVWTHTLLIDFTDLVVISDVASSLALFLHPNSLNDVNLYSKPLNIRINVLNNTRASLPFNMMFLLLEAIYGTTKDCVYVETTKDVRADEIAMALWLQQWPRLRRNFRFCTLSSSDRSRSDEQFDLQFIPHKVNIQSRNRGGKRGQSIDISGPLPKSPNQLLTTVATDAIAENKNSDLRKFLWRYGAETDAGRSAFLPLAQIWIALEKSSQPDVVVAVDALNNIKPSIKSLSLRVLQDIVQVSAIRDVLSTSVVEFFIRNLTLLGEMDFGVDKVKVAKTILRHAPERIWSVFRDESDMGRSVAAAAANLMRPEEVIHSTIGDDNLFCTVLEANPKLAESPLIWDAPSPIPNRTAEILSKLGEPDTAVLRAMLESDNIDLPKIAINIFGQVAVDTAVEYYDKNDDYKKRQASRWLIASKNHPKYLQTSIAQAKERNIETLAFIASIVSYCSRPVTQDMDEWVLALKHIRGDLENRSFSFCAFLLGRALSGISPEPGVLIRFSFDTVHDNLIESRGDYKTWLLLETELPKVSWWSRWDRAQRVRSGVVNIFVERDLPAKEFLEITNSEEVFVRLVNLVSSSIAGRGYLRKVSSWVRNNSDEVQSRFGNIVENAVDKGSSLLLTLDDTQRN